MAALLCLTRSGGDDAGAGATRREVVGHSLYGVDLLDDAALICSLRLWLALLPAGSKEPVEPLPNLDRRVRQGDALVDPLELGAALPGPPGSASEHARIRRIIRDLTPLAERYLNAEPRERTILRRQIGRAERRLASSWVGALTGSLARTEREMRARSADRDLFGEPAAHAVAATRSLPAVLQSRAALDRFAEDVADPRSLPFFSFRVHFPEAAEGFDLILSNPPWVRSHDWPAPVKQLLRETYTVCRYAGWPEAARLTGVPAAAGGQVDLALLFLERCAGLLAPHGTLGLVLPAKLFRSLAAGGARRLLRRDIVPAAIEDHSLDHRGIFEADAFPAVLLARKPAAAPARTAVRITLTRAGSEPLAFEQSPEELPLHVGDDRAPWLLAPTECLAAFRHMQRHPPIGDHDALHVRRGAITGCNAALVLRRVEPKLGELARIEAEGAHGAGRDVAGYRAHVEASAIRPVLRGTDVRAWSARVERHVIWVPANDDPAAPTPPRMQRYLQRHRTLLRPAGTHRLGCLERVGRHTLGHKVVWSDLSRELRAAAVPALTRSALGTDLPLIPLNSVYFIATSTYDDALLLAAYMNSTVFGTFARAAAERAKDAHFRFFAWTIAALPLPRDWRTNSQAPALTGISSDAHRSGGLAPLDRQKLDHLVAQAYSLGHEQQDAIAVLARWFDGARSPEKQPPRTLPGDSCDESA